MKKSANKFENARNSLLFVKASRGENMADKVTVCKRMQALASRESPNDWYPKLTARLDSVSVYAEIQIEKMMSNNSLDSIITVMKSMPDDGLIEGNLPKLNWTDWNCVFQAMKFMTPWKSTNDLKTSSKHLSALFWGLGGVLHRSAQHLCEALHG